LIHDIHDCHTVHESGTVLPFGRAWTFSRLNDAYDISANLFILYAIPWINPVYTTLREGDSVCEIPYDMIEVLHLVFKELSAFLTEMNVIAAKQAIAWMIGWR
jgi:hypothetical protein